MVATVQSNSAQGGTVLLVGNQPWVRRYNGTANNQDQAYAVVADKDGNIIVGGYSYVIFLVGLLTIAAAHQGAIRLNTSSSTSARLDRNRRWSSLA
jgi:hypothetical protein